MMPPATNREQRQRVEDPMQTRGLVNGTFAARYSFSDIEKDTEIGYNYFGTRYHRSDLSISLSVFIIFVANILL